MKVTEIRIGNLIQNGEDICRVNAIYLSHFTVYNSNDIELNSIQYNLSPIPLTEEWLLKFGFEKSLKNRLYYIDNMRLICHENIFIKISGAKYNLKHIQFVHQLQNLYFVMTGKELDVGFLMLVKK